MAAPISADSFDSSAAAAASTTKRVSKPDRPAFNAKVDDITRQVDVIKAKLDKLKEQINGAGSNEKSSPEKQQLNEQIEAIKAEEAKLKDERAALLSQLKQAQDGVKRKVDEIKNTKEKMAYRSTGEIDRKIAEIDSQVSSGSLKLTEEKRLLSEASALRKHRKTIESLGPQESLIEMDKKKADDIRKQLDKIDPQLKGYKKQLDDLFKALRVFQNERNENSKTIKALRTERDELSKQMSELLQQRKEMHAEFKKQREEYDAFWKEEKARKDALYKAQRAEYARQKRLENVQRALEDAEIPAFENEISMCNALSALLVSYTGVKSVADEKEKQTTSTARPVSDSEPSNLPKGFTGTVMLKKKSDRIGESFYQGKQQKQPKQHHSSSSVQTKDLKLDLAVIDHFFKLNVNVPSKPADIPKTLEMLEEKKKYFVANQERVTKENIEKAKKKEAEVLKELEQESASASCEPPIEPATQ